MNIIRKIIHRLRYHLIHRPKERVWRAWVIYKTKKKPVLIIER
jgi:hypothetical protein